MISILVFLLLFSIVLRVYPPKKPNYFYGYQLGSAKKSDVHWKIANKYASIYMMTLYGLVLALTLIFTYQNYDGGLLIFGIFIVGSIMIFALVERKLKRVK